MEDTHSIHEEDHSLKQSCTRTNTGILRDEACREERAKSTPPRRCATSSDAAVESTDTMSGTAFALGSLSPCTAVGIGVLPEPKLSLSWGERKAPPPPAKQASRH